MSSRNYSTIGNFGNCLLVNSNYGYDVCMFDGIDKCFAKGPGPVNDLGPEAPNCQAFMAEQCSIDWNPKCEMYYRYHNNSNQRFYPNTYSAGSCQVSLLLGDSLLLNAAELRFFTVNSDDMYTIPLDPTNYSSPMITQFIGRRRLDQESLSERFHKDTIDNDAIMIRLLQRPKPFVKLLHQIYLHVMNNIYCLDHDTIGPFQEPCHYNPNWDIRGTRTWEALQMMFNNGSTCVNC